MVFKKRNGHSSDPPSTKSSADFSFLSLPIKFKKRSSLAVLIAAEAQPPTYNQIRGCIHTTPSRLIWYHNLRCRGEGGSSGKNQPWAECSAFSTGVNCRATSP